MPTVRGVPDPVFVMARLRRVLYRPAVRRLAVTIIVVATMATVAALLRATDAARSRWGDTRPIAVAERDLAPGEGLDASAVALRDLPEALVPDGALEDEPIGAIARYPITAGEPLVADRLAPMGVSGTAALVPDGHRAVGLPASQLSLPPVQPGDLVDVLVLLPSSDSPVEHGADQGHSQDHHIDNAPWSPRPAEPAFPVVTDARVLSADDQVVTVTVPAPDAPRVAYAVASGIVVLTLTGH